MRRATVAAALVLAALGFVVPLRATRAQDASPRPAPPPSPAARAAPALAGEWTVRPQTNGDGRSLEVRWPQEPAEAAYLEALAKVVEAKKTKAELEKKNAPVPPDVAAAAAAMPEPPAYEVVVLISGTPGGKLVEVARAGAMEAWVRDQGDVYGAGAAGSTDHVIFVRLANVIPPRDLALAAFAARKPEPKRSAAEAATIEKVRGLLGEDAIAAADAILRKSEASSPEDLTPVILEGYFGRGNLTGLIVRRDWRVQLATRAPGGPLVEAGPPKTVRPSAALFHRARLNNFVTMVVLGGLVLWFIEHAKKNPNLFLRRIGGLDAVDEALGRATEMGKAVLFVHGLRTMQDISTVAAVNILGEIAKKVARYDSKLMCVNNDPIVFAVSQETVKEGYMDAGRPDAYNPDDVFFVAAEQFSYVAAVDGIMVRQKPAANFYCGYFYAESLLLAETGATTGAIQIAATDAYTQLPFFVTTCDYTLMGEELYAASAYLSRDPLLLGSLKGQDVGKILIVALLVVGTALASFGFPWIKDILKPY